MAYDLRAYLIDRCRKRFLKDGNPLHIWAAYRLARGKVVPTLGPGGLFSTMNVGRAATPLPPLPLPDWITEYFDICADGLLSGTDPTDALLMTVKVGRVPYTGRSSTAIATRTLLHSWTRSCP